MPESLPPEPRIKTFLKSIRHQLKIRFSKRSNVVYTQFYRFHHQYSVLCDKVLPHLSEDHTQVSRPLEIILFGSSDGSEPYSLASVLLARRPDLDFRIRAYDIVGDLVERAKTRRYTRVDAYRSPFVSEDFVRRTFDVDGDVFTIREPIASRVSFAVGNILDDALIGTLGQSDMVFAQNFLFHLDRPDARHAFVNLARLLKPRSALFIDGMDTDMRISLTKEYGLLPVDYLVKEVHEDAFANHGAGWAQHYWGRVPFSASGRDWLRRFGTVYLRSPA